jgi:hypothetical protein
MTMFLCLTPISGDAGAASSCNELFDRIWANHGGVIADVDDICAPIDVNSGDMWLRAKGLLDRVCTLNAVDILQRKACLLFCMWMGVSH